MGFVVVVRDSSGGAEGLKFDDSKESFVHRSSEILDCTSFDLKLLDVL
jgi:hypothetical protein